ncbi:MAG: hypothetical protein AAF738_11330 [Bacteroidota bacterium]
MGLLNDLKKIAFGTKAVSQSAAQKTANAGRETINKSKAELEERLHQTSTDALETAEQLGETILEHANELWTRTKNTTEEILEKQSEKFTPSKSSTPNNSAPSVDVQDFVSAAFEDTTPPESESTHQHATSTSAEQTNEATFDEAIQEIGKQGKAAFKKGKAVLDDLLDKAEKVSEQLKEEIGEDEYIEKVQVGYENAKSSLMNGHDDFFEKAAKYATGDYHGTTLPEAQQKDAVQLRKNPDYKKTIPKGKVKGFEDLDGDGNEVIDDAIIVDDKKKRE